MTISEARANAVELVRRGFDESAGVEWFRVAFDVQEHCRAAGLEAIGAALEAIGAYNGFDPVRAAAAVRAAAPFAWRISVGREFSPVLYLELEDAAAAPAVLEQLRGAGPDELYAAPAGEHDAAAAIVRAWWD